MSYTREQWVRAFLASAGNSNPSQAVVNWVINWTAQEGSYVGGQGAYNLLNTTQPMPGSYGGGSQGNIQYFASFQSGVQANAIVIKNGYYPDLYNALMTNNISSLCAGSGRIQQEMGTWGTGWKSWYCGTPASSLLAQQFPGTATNVPGGLPNPLTTPLSTTTQPVRPTYTGLLEQVHQTLINAPGFYGIALALDEAEQFPGWIDLTVQQPDVTVAGVDTGFAPPDVTGLVRSTGATLYDNTMPFLIRSGLITIGGILVVALLLKAVEKPVERAAEIVGPIARMAA